MSSDENRGMTAICPTDPRHRISRFGPMLDGSITVRCADCDSLDDGSADIGPWKPRPRLLDGPVA